jgi:SAM-dependent methyltransferase/glycosyltransferase involved in cell wall biosynthesis
MTSENLETGSAERDAAASAQETERTPPEGEPLEVSDERFSPGQGIPENAYEHWHRYLWARRYAQGHRVLDVASGEGYGTDLLAAVARSVVGVDRSAEAVHHARDHYRRDNLQFLIGDASRLPIEGSALFDVVVSFETIEHLTAEDQPRFLAEVKRVLAPGGVFLVSTPDKVAYQAGASTPNEFHEREFSAEEFRAFLGEHFPVVRFFGQKVYPASYLWSVDEAAEGFEELQLADAPGAAGPRPAAADAKRLVYLVAACSEKPLPPPAASVLLDTTEAAIRARIEEAVANRWRHEQAELRLRESERLRTALGQEAAREREDLSRSLGEAERRSGALDAEGRRLREALDEQGRRSEALGERLGEAERRWDEQERSRGARLLRQLRAAKATLAPPRTARERALSLGFRGARLLKRQGFRGAVSRLVGRAAPEEGLIYSLDRPLPERLEVGRGTVLRVSGWCFHESAGVESVDLLVDGLATPASVFRIKRPDVHVANRSRDPHRHGVFSGFEGLVPLLPPEGREVSLELRVRTRGGTRMWRPLGSIRLEGPPSPPPVSLRARVAICLATYEPPEALLVRQVESIRRQSFEDWLCIVVDDGSSASARARIARVVSGDPRFVTLFESENVGFYRNFERAMRAVPPSTELVVLSDQDDLWSEDKLASLLKALGPAAQLAYSDMRIVRTDGRVLAESYWTGRDNNHRNLPSLLLANTITGAASMFRRELLDALLPFPERIGEAYHDHWLGLNALVRGEVAYVDRPLYDYVQHGSNVLGHHVGQGALSRFRELCGESLAVVRGGPERRQVLDAWEAIFRSDVMRMVQFARAMQIRTCDEHLPRRRRRVLRRFTSLDRPGRSLPWLLARGTVRGALGHNDTVGAEFYVAKGLLWKALTGVRAQVFPWRSAAAVDVPEPALSGTEHRLAEQAEAMARKIAPLRLDISASEPRRVNLLVPSVDLRHFFGGYITKFNLALKLARAGHRVRIVTVDPSPPLPDDWRRELQRYAGLEDLFAHVEIAHASDRSVALAVNPEDGVIATTWWTAHIAADAVRQLGAPPFVYLIQEYEPLTFAMGSWAALAEESYRFPHRAVFSSELLREYFRQNRLGVFAAPDGESISFQNAITDVGPVDPGPWRTRKTRRLLFYARPESHAARNMFELGMLVLNEAIRSGVFSEDWEFSGIGTTASGVELPLVEGRVLRLLPRQSQERYRDVLLDHDVGLGLMYTPHPSLVPIEMASAGMVVVTNTFANKTADALRGISPNIVAVEPTVRALVEGLRTAVRRSEDEAGRLAGAQVAWSRSWNASFGPEQMRVIEGFLRRPGR